MNIFSSMKNFWALFGTIEVYDPPPFAKRYLATHATFGLATVSHSYFTSVISKLTIIL